LRSISAKILGDENLYAALLDANPGLFSDYRNLKVGARLLIPDMKVSDDKLDDIRYRSENGASYLRMADYSENIPYEKDKTWKGPRYYTWKEGDDMRSVASKLYDDEDLYPLLVDANKKRLIHPANLIAGVVLVVPPLPALEWLEAVHQKSWMKSYYMWWKNASQDEN
jgi:hypothetical protein